ncbi:hypothetical protein CMsap09_04795 [Clavibacter michiganensis]|uniref:Serine protease n=1 Tax=Clavibacter michiganensis TaxID=28447 RepID=A0A251XRN2_9MICO|nr:hypothetical protein CMsap09_04795 [Clavibacter michiganensis]
MHARALSDRRHPGDGGAPDPGRGRRGRVLRAAVGAAVALAVGCGGAAGVPVAAEAHARPDAQPAAPSSIHQDADDAVAYWTPERIRAAVPDDGGVTAGRTAPVADAELVHSAPGRLGAQSSIGILTFLRGGQEKSCTASAIRSGSGLMVATAGHCLVRGGESATRIAFTPGWDGANRPYGTWGGDEYQVPDAWRSGGDVGHDAAFVRMLKRPSGPLLADAVKALTPDFGLAKAGLHYLTLGYPGSPSNLVSKPLSTCVGPAYPTADGRLAMVGCAAEGGMSGGPLIHVSTAAARGTQTGVISTSYDGLFGVGTAVTPWGATERRVFDDVDSFG